MSVVIPTYNASATVAVALASVAFQTFRDYEVIVVDDASLDGTAELVELWIRQCEDSANGQTQSRGQSPHHRIIRLAVNRGPAAARNAGVAAARGEWIAFLDGDDAWLPCRLATQAEALARYPDAVLVCGELALSRGEAPEDVARRLSDPGTAGARDVPLEDFLESNPVPTSTVLARRAALTAAGGFDPRFRGPEDIDLWMRIAAAGRIVRLAAPDARAEALKTLNDFWEAAEISGVALTDMAVWHWMYEHPEATPAELKAATLTIARDLWNRYYAPVFKQRDVTLLAVYSHMIRDVLYLPDYPIGHLIGFQIEEQMRRSGRFGAEFERMTVLGNVTPDMWMKNATGAPVGAEAMLAATKRALTELAK